MTTDELLSRGVDSVVPEKGLKEKIEGGKKLRVYFGIDPTGSDIHLGHSIPLRKLRDFQRAGHHCIFLIGSFTAMIGDPTGRDEVRQPLTREQVEKNFHNYKEQASKILDFSKLEVVYNDEWLDKLSFAQLLELSSHFTVQQMMQRDMFKERMRWKVVCENCGDKFNSPIQFNEEQDLEQTELKGNSTKCPHCHKITNIAKGNLLPPPSPVTSHEFMYPLMQGYDSVHLEVDLEIGGTDQLFNMMAGRKLMKAYKNKEKFCMTTPIVEGLDGRKMSKTYNNTVNITDAPADMFGKIMSLSDDLIIKYFIYCTDLPIKEIDAIDSAIKAGQNPRDAKIKLAQEIVSMYHSADEGIRAADEFANVFKKGGLPDDVPEFKLTGDRNIVDLLELCKLVESRGEAKRAIAQGGVKINDKTVKSVDEVIKLKKDMIVKVGKRRFAKIA